ncbi:hypothetical protein CEXT_622971 [Caerostris extrusa]|uniref:Uncharacterized protein n=1 Tax=Caerostris extrusa TaxID=172846 RepID=A0AAV4XS45_CAEEX|nr:hypothetical protein CEXT_622971 [Caerostris extrusa]
MQPKKTITQKNKKHFHFQCRYITTNSTNLEKTLCTKDQVNIQPSDFVKHRHRRINIDIQLVQQWPSASKFLRIFSYSNRFIETTNPAKNSAANNADLRDSRERESMVKQNLSWSMY